MFAHDEGSKDAESGSAEPSEAGVPSLPLERLEHEIVQLASHINAGTCRWLELVAEFDRREGWGSWGCRSCAEWVAWRCALDTRSAREHVRVARRLEELPRIHAAFSSGHLSYSKVRALTRVADGDSEADLLELAEHATAAQLERIVRGMRRMTTEDANESHELRFLSTWWESDGSLSISGNLPAEEGAAFLVALDAMHDLIRTMSTTCASGDGRVRDHGGPAEPASEADTCGSAEPPESRTATNADALAAMAESALVTAADPGPAGPAGGDVGDGGASDGRSGGARYELVVHVDAATLASDASATARVEDGSALAPETIRRLACDCSIVPLLEDADGATLSVGRRTRSVPPSIARALRARDGTCAFPGCENRRFLDAHHIRHWAHGGETSADNLIRLCRHHHRLVHEGGCSIERGTDGSVRFCDRHGQPLVAAPKPPPGRAARLSVEAALRGTRAEAMQPGSGERLDLGQTLSALAARSARRQGTRAGSA